jgi:hypothetical protein
MLRKYPDLGVVPPYPGSFRKWQAKDLRYAELGRIYMEDWRSRKEDGPAPGIFGKDVILQMG